jgi:hypothetical protein
MLPEAVLSASIPVIQRACRKDYRTEPPADTRRSISQQLLLLLLLLLTMSNSHNHASNSPKPCTQV